MYSFPAPVVVGGAAAPVATIVVVRASAAVVVPAAAAVVVQLRQLSMLTTGSDAETSSADRFRIRRGAWVGRA